MQLITGGYAVEIIIRATDRHTYEVNTYIDYSTEEMHRSLL
jgi:hypothetical protein